MPTAELPSSPPTFTPWPEVTPTPVIALPETAPALPTLAVDTPAPLPTQALAVVGITQTIGFSTQGRPITAYRFGIGTDRLVLVGGIHGGYEWNTIVLSYQMIDYFLENPQEIPAHVTVYIIPSANPDGQFLVTGKDGRFTAADVGSDIRPGRFNGNDVDLNRNWACDWAQTGFWGTQAVSGGERPFSEPETQALSRFFIGQQVDAVIFYHSKADGVYSGGCGASYPPALNLSSIYGQASGYPVNEQFTNYEVTGDASDWLALQGIPSFTVELKTRNELDWSENLAGVQAMLHYFDNR